MLCVHPFSFPLIIMALIKNPKGRIVEVSDERKVYLLDPKPVHTRPDGKRIALVKSRHEEGYTEPSASEVKQYEAGNEKDAKPEKVELKEKEVEVVEKKKTKKQLKEEEAALEIEVRDAEGDVEKYEALSDDGKKLYIELFESAPEKEEKKEEEAA